MNYYNHSFMGGYFLMYFRNGKKIKAVIGTDFSIYYFNQMLQDKYPICANKTRYT